MTACKRCGNEIQPCGWNARVCSPCKRSYESAYGQRYRKSKPLAVAAHDKVANAVLKGGLPRLDGTIPCDDCGKPATQYDHRDYSKQLDVAPVCASCNRLRGPGLNAA